MGNGSLTQLPNPRLSDAAGEVSWNLMLYKETLDPELWEPTSLAASRVCEALESAREVVAENRSGGGNGDTLLGPATKRRLIEDQHDVEPIVSSLVDLLPAVRAVLNVKAPTKEHARFLQREFAALTMILQDRGL